VAFAIEGYHLVAFVWSPKVVGFVTRWAEDRTLASDWAKPHPTKVVQVARRDFCVLLSS
jgi:hypothetical protein